MGVRDSTIDSSMTKKQWPLILTLSRMFLTIPIVILIHRQEPWALILATVIFMLASVTDYFDGYYARKYNAVTQLGKFMDPVADKVLVTSVLAMLLQFSVVNSWVLILFVGRDTIVGGIRSAAVAEGLVIDAKATGKWKAALQMICIPLLILPPWPINFGSSEYSNHTLGLGLLWASVVLSLFSGWQYLQLYREISGGPLASDGK